MREALALLRAEPRARLFFAILTQSSLGNGAGYVALLLVAYDRSESAWGISLVLLADFLPSMIFGPLLGAAADRWSRRWCMILSDVARAAAFISIAFTDSIELTLALALLAGTGTALFRPAAFAALPSLAGAADRRAAATSLFAAVTDLGYTGGPAVAAIVLALSSPEGLLVANGLTFVVSAVALLGMRFGEVTEAPPPASDGKRLRALLSETREGFATAVRMPVVNVVILISSASMLSGGIFNVIELPFATDVLDAGPSGYSALVTVYGLAFIVGSLTGSRGGGSNELRQRFILGILLTGVGGIAAGLAPSLVFALLAFGLAGLGNGVSVVHLRLIIQSHVEDRLHGRVFGVSDTLTSWFVAAGFVSAGAITGVLDPRPLLYLTGSWELLLALATVLLVRKVVVRDVEEVSLSDVEERDPLPLGGSDSLGRLHARD